MPIIPKKASLLSDDKHRRQEKFTEGLLNRVAGVICSFDPCMNCSTFAGRNISLNLRLVTLDGALLDEIRGRP